MCAAKPSLFSRPAWAANPTSQTGSSEKAVFGQQRVYDEIMAEETRRKEERDARKKAKAEKAAVKAEAAAKAKEEDGHKAKKRRVSKEQTHPQNSDSDDDSSTKSSSDRRTTTPEPAAQKRVTRSTPTKRRDLVAGLDDPKTKSESQPTVISLDEDDEDGNMNKSAHAANNKVVVPSKSTSRKPAVSDEEEDDDPFIREVRRKAREKARQQELERSRVAQSMSPVRAGSVHTASHDRDQGTSLSPHSVNARSTPDASASQPRALEPNVAILIKTLIPGTKDLVINRHSSQTLLYVKNYWCERYKLEPSFAQQVFFTWRGSRLYNSTTMMSLINILKKEQGIPLYSDEDPSNGKIQINAVTADILEQQEKAKDAAAKAQQEAEQVEAEEGEEEAEKRKKDGVILLLKCKDVDEMTLRVRPNTGVAKIMRAFQSQRNIDKSKTCWLVFDGERLDPTQSVQDVGFEDQDEVEVHPR